MQHLPWVGGGDRLRASALLLRCEPTLRPRLRRRCNPTSRGQRGSHDHAPGHVPESGPSLGAPRCGSTPSPLADPGYWQIGGLGGGESHRCQGHRSGAPSQQEAHHPNRNDRSVAEFNRERGGGHMGRLVWHGLSASTSRSTVWGCGEQIIDRHRFAFAGWIVHTECAVDTVQGASGSGGDRLEMTIRGRNEPPRRRTFRLTEILPRLPQRVDGATDWGIHRRGQLAKSWRSAIFRGGGGGREPRPT